MRNGLQRETAAPPSDALASIAALLPPTWSLTAHPVHDLSPTQPDFIIEIAGPSGPVARFAGVAKTSASLSAGRQATMLLHLSRVGALPVLLVADYVGPALREQLTAAGVAYADATGWVRVTHTDPLIHLVGQGTKRAPKPRTQSATTRLNGVSVARTITALTRAELPVGVRDLADRAHSSPASVSKLLATLEAEGIVERDTARKVVAVRARDLVRRWAQDYSFTRTNRTVNYYIAPRGLSWLNERLEALDVPVLLTGSAAARRLLPDGVMSVVPLTLMALYAHDPDSLATGFRLIDADPTTANVVIAVPQDHAVVPPSGVGIAPVPLVLADLLTLPGRSDAEAEQLMDFMARTNPGWRTSDDAGS